MRLAASRVGYARPIMRVVDMVGVLRVQRLHRPGGERRHQHSERHDAASRRAASTRDGSPEYSLALFDEALDPEAVGAIRDATNGNYVLGSERFRTQIAEMLGRRVTRGTPGRPRKTETR